LFLDLFAKKDALMICSFCIGLQVDISIYQKYPLGVHLEKTTDGKGQQWRTVEDAIKRDGNDIVIVGRGIIGASNLGKEAARYQQAAWDAIQKREQ
jgi:hypothetical protein